MESEEEFDYIVDKEGVSSPYWLEKTLGSLSEERRNSLPKSYSSYNRLVRKARRNFYGDFILDKISSNPDNFLIKLSDLEALYPSTTFELHINVQDLTKSNQRLLRSFLFYFYTREWPKWIEYLVEESFDKILKTENIYQKSKIFKENLIIRQSFLVLGRNQGLELLENIYSTGNILRWIETGKNLSSQYSIVKIPYAKVKQKIWRRGYKESSSNKHKTKNQEKEVILSMENQSLEETRKRILAKQAELFEKRLDRYLQIESSELNQTEKRRIFSTLLENDQKTTAEQENFNIPKEE